MSLKLLFYVFVLVIAVVGYRYYQHSGSAPAVGQRAPDFDLPDSQGKQHTLNSYRGKWLVLYFYPKDDTPGCTKEACNFRDDLHKLEQLGAQVVGVSVDDTSSHEEFAKKYHLPFPLLADTKGVVAEKYGALADMGVTKIAKRFTYLIDPLGVLQKVYLNVDASRHSQEIIDDLGALLAQKPNT